SALQGNTEPIDEALAKLNEAPALDDNANRLREELRLIVVRARDVAGMNAETAAAKSTRDEVAASVIKDFRAWEERQREWLRNDARNYGLAIQEAQEKPDGTNEAGKGGDTTPQPTDENRAP
ncbi:MAG: hypothetical protein ACR2LZ_05835, partial [Pyrinomonadaceae bacterium]